MEIKFSSPVDIRVPCQVTPHTRPRIGIPRDTTIRQRPGSNSGRHVPRRLFVLTCPKRYFHRPADYNLRNGVHCPIHRPSKSQSRESNAEGRCVTRLGKWEVDVPIFTDMDRPVTVLHVREMKRGKRNECYIFSLKATFLPCQMNKNPSQPTYLSKERTFTFIAQRSFPRLRS